MRILWVKIGGLWPLDRGGRLRSFNLLHELSRTHEITVITTREPGFPADELARRLPDCRDVIEIPYRPVKHADRRFPFVFAKSWLAGRPVDIERARIPALAKVVRSCLDTGGFDLCVADFLWAIPNVPRSSRTPIVLFEHNVEYMIWQRLARTASWPRRLVLEAEWRRVRRYERAACRRVSRTIGVSDADRDHLRALAPGAPVYSVPTGVDVGYFAPRPQVAERREVVFVGSMDWYPNEDAMRWFSEAILPALRKRVPDVHITVVGRNPSVGFCQSALVHGMQVTGTVPDVRDYVARAAVCVVPLRIGGGTRLKIFEGLAMGKATVTTTVGAEGLPLVDGHDVVFADEPEDFADRVAELLGDPKRRRLLGEAGRERVTGRHAWPRVAREFASLCQPAAAAFATLIPPENRCDSSHPGTRIDSRPQSVCATATCEKGARL